MPCTGPTVMGTKSCSRGTLTPPWYRGFQCCSQTDRKDRRCMTQCSCLGKDADTPGLKKNLTHMRHFQPTASSQRSASLGALNSQRLKKIISMLGRRFSRNFIRWFIFSHLPHSVANVQVQPMNRPERIWTLWCESHENLLLTCDVELDCVAIMFKEDIIWIATIAHVFMELNGLLMIDVSMLEC